MDLSYLTSAPSFTPAFAPGERVAVVGPKGAGKSALLAELARQWPGACLLSGRFPFLDDELTGWENIRQVLGRGQAERAASAFCGLGELLDLRVMYYSSGMRWRLGFTLATAHPSDMLLADRPMWGGDLSFRERVLYRLERLTARSRLAVLVGADLAWLSKVCTRAVWLQEGRVVRDGPARDVLAEYRMVSRRLAA
jgi:ABC-2 type transport system ATP-binding protein/lipopolysaccharide transport system ATP-binding protein